MLRRNKYILHCFYYCCVLLLFCFVLFFNSTEFSVRLEGGLSSSQGTVELFINGQWASICGDKHKWNLAVADIVCRHLGFKFAILASTEHQDGRGISYQLYCPNTATVLHQCKAELEGDCYPYAGVVCSVPSFLGAPMGMLNIFVMRCRGISRKSNM